MGPRRISPHGILGTSQGLSPENPWDYLGYPQEIVEETQVCPQEVLGTTQGNPKEILGPPREIPYSTRDPLESLVRSFAYSNSSFMILQNQSEGGWAPNGLLLLPRVRGWP